MRDEAPRSEPKDGSPEAKLQATPRAAGHWFEPIAEHLGEAYLRYSFTKGTAQEVAALVEMLDLQPGQRVLDVGCGPGRHALALAHAGLQVDGVDISDPFIDQARAQAATQGVGERTRFMVADARTLDPEIHQGYDAVISLCQGAFGLAGGPGSTQRLDRELDEPIMAGMARALAPGGQLAVSAFSAYFQVHHLEDHDTFDADAGVNHELTSVRNPEGADRPAELWTTCFTPRELRLLIRLVGLEALAVHGVTPGAYRPGPPSIDAPELLVIARRPDSEDGAVGP